MLETEDVLPDLTSELNKKPETNLKRTVTQAFEDSVKSDIENVAITPKTKQRIMRIASSLSKTNPDIYLPLIKKLSGITEAEAQQYLDCLEACRNKEAYSALSARVIDTISDIIIHPEDDETRMDMQQDEVLKSLMGHQVGTILEMAGGAALLFLLIFYGLTSWSKIRRISAYIDHASFQNVGNSEEPVRKDNTDGETPEIPVDTNVQ